MDKINNSITINFNENTKFIYFLNETQSDLKDNFY